MVVLWVICVRVMIIISYEDEKIDNIHFVGGSSIFGAGVHNAIYSGYFIASKILESEVNDGE